MRTTRRRVWWGGCLFLGAGWLINIPPVSDVCGWLFVLLTAPVGTAWWTYGYDFVLSVVGTPAALTGSVALVAMAGDFFWFSALPAILRKVRESRAACRIAA